jgi:hypothetical protein
MSEVTWDPRLWSEVLYPIYRDFADLWALRVLPGRMDTKVKTYIQDMVRKYSHITEIPCVTRKRLLQAASQISPSSFGSARESTPDESDCAEKDARFLA